MASEADQRPTLSDSATRRWRVGAVEVSAVVETTDAFAPAFLRQLLPDATPDALAAMPWLAPRWVDARGDLRFVTQAFVVRSRGRVILVDACIGNDKPRRNPAWHELRTPFLERLAAAGAAPAEVDTVLCTHLHFDHVGWLARWDGASWRPTFERARVLVHRAEWEHWVPRPGHAYVVADSLGPVADAGLVDLVDLAGGGYDVTDEVRLEASPGHTPGHVVVRIRSEGAEAFITGDALHHPCQIGRPDWTSPSDSDRDAARATRERLLSDAAARGVWVFGTHFAAPAGGRVVAGRFEPGDDEGQGT